MATAFPHADRTASEARRPEAGSRAGGVSRAERGNDGSPSGAKPRRGFDAQHDSATGHLPGGRGRPNFNGEEATGSGRAHASHRGPGADAVWPIRRSRVGGVQGRQACAAGIARRAFPWRQAKCAAPQARRYRRRAQQKERCAAPAGTTHRRQRGAISSPPAPSSTATGRSRQALRTRKPACPRSAR